MHYFRAVSPKWVLPPMKETSCHNFKMAIFSKFFGEIYRWFLDIFSVIRIKNTSSNAFCRIWITYMNIFKDINIWICHYSCRILPGSVLCTTSLELLSEKITSPLRKIRLKLFFAKKKKKYTHERTYCKKTLKLFHASFILKAKFHDANQSRIFTEWHKQSCYLRCRVFRRSNKT